MVCVVHGGSRISLQQIKREAVNLGPLAIEALEEIIQAGDNSMARVAAVKTWMDLTGARELANTSSGLEDEELSAARASLGTKLEMVLRNLTRKAKTA
jgi:hypothetical protein